MKNRNSADFCRLSGNGIIVAMVCSNVDIMQSIIGIAKGKIEDGLV